MTQSKPYERQAVTNLQRYLRQLAHEDSSITQPPIDGIFDTVTRQALIDFQNKNSLPATGIADRATWDLLFGQYTDSLRSNTLPIAVNIFPRRPAGYELQRGDINFYVMALQFMLNELSRDYGELINLTPDGNYGDATASAVSLYQKLNSLPETGRVGLATWNSIAAAYNNRSNEYVQ